MPGMMDWLSSWGNMEGAVTKEGKICSTMDLGCKERVEKDTTGKQLTMLLEEITTGWVLRFLTLQEMQKTSSAGRS